MMIKLQRNQNFETDSVVLMTIRYVCSVQGTVSGFWEMLGIPTNHMGPQCIVTQPQSTAIVGNPKLYLDKQTNNQLEAMSHPHWPIEECMDSELFMHSWAGHFRVYFLSCEAMREINTKMTLELSAQTVHHESTYIILFLTQHSEPINDNENSDLHISSPCIAHSFYVLLMTSQ